MALYALLLEKKKLLTEKWLEAIYRTYPLDTVGFLRRQKDQFNNPVGHLTTQAVTSLVEQLLSPELDPERIAVPIDDIVRIRAVQSFKPSGGVGIFFLFKALVREVLEPSLRDVAICKELLQFETKVDSVALLAFDIHSRCREQLFEMRVNEVKNSQFKLLQRARMIVGVPAEDLDPPKW